MYIFPINVPNSPIIELLLPNYSPREKQNNIRKGGHNWMLRT